MFSIEVLCNSNKFVSIFIEKCPSKNSFPDLYL